MMEQNILLEFNKKEYKNIMEVKYTLQKLRNVGIIAHIDAGKTTTTERILYHAGTIDRMGNVDDGTTQTDWMAQERERGITITSACTTSFWKDCRINIIDTPGHIDFTVEVERSLRVLDGAVVIFCAVGGVESQSETVWRQADRYHVPRIAFINKMDRIEADFFGTLKQIQQRLGANAAAVEIPIGVGQNLEGVIDLIKMKSLIYDIKDITGRFKVGSVSPDLLEMAKLYRAKLIESVAETDKNIMEKFSHDQEIKEGELSSAIRRQTIAGKFVPVLCGSSLKNIGVQPILDAVVDWLPSPVDVPPVQGIVQGKDVIEQRKASDDEYFSALAFKIMIDPYVGKLTFLRVYSGILKSGSYIYNVSRDKKERIGKLLKMHANRQEIIEVVKTGDIAAAVGLRETKTGDTICDEQHPVILESMHLPQPVISLAIEPLTRQDQDKLSLALSRLQDEDPSFCVSYNEETAQTLILGFGELHLEIIVDRLKREFNVQTQVGKPHVAYKETLIKPVRQEGKFVQQSGGRGQYGHVVFEIEPIERGSGIVFESALRGTSIPREYVPSIEQGVIESAQTGPLGGFPVVDVKVVLIDGSYHEVDSSTFAFKMAGSIGFSAALRSGGSMLLEPIMDVEVVVPEEYLGDVIADMGARRAKIEQLSQRGNVRVIRGFIPLSELFGYATAVRSVSQGRASYVMQPAYYAEVPKNIKEKILKGKK